MTELRRGDLGEYALAGRVAVVTGGSSGIGAATVRRLAASGATVVVGYNSGLDRAKALVAELPWTPWVSRSAACWGRKFG